MKVLKYFMLVVLVLVFTVTPVLAVTTINYDESLSNPYTWRPCIWYGGSYKKTSWDYIEPSLAYQSYSESGAHIYYAYQYIDRIAGRWGGYVKDVTAKNWLCVDMKQGQFPKSTWNPCPLKAQDYTLYPDSNGYLPLNKLMLTVTVRRTMNPTLWGTPSNPLISQYPMCALGVDIWFDLDPDGENDMWVYSSPSPNYPPKLVVIDLFFSRWIFIVVWHEIEVDEYPYGNFITDQTPYDRDVHGLFVVGRCYEKDTWYGYYIDVGKYWNRVADFIRSNYGYVPTKIKIKCIAPFIESIGAEFSGEFDYLQLVVN